MCKSNDFFQTLEVLTTSQTLISALRGCFDLRIFSMWSAFLILVWALSPVGGQAVLRSMETTVHEASQTYPLRFYPSNNIVANTGSSSMTGGSSAASVRVKCDEPSKHPSLLQMLQFYCQKARVRTLTKQLSDLEEKSRLPSLPKQIFGVMSGSHSSTSCRATTTAKPISGSTYLRHS